MALLSPSEGEKQLLTDMLSGGTLSNHVLKLYTNAYAPLAGSTVGSFTEATFTGYTSNTGTAYAYATVSGGTGSGATAWVTLSGGVVTAVTILSGGTGYTAGNNVTLSVVSTAGTSAGLNSITVSSGSITGGTVVGGSGYYVGGKVLTRSLSGTTWSTPTLATPSVSQYNASTPQSWSSTSAQTIQGYYIVDVVTGKVVWAEQFTSAISLVNPSTFTLIPQITLT